MNLKLPALSATVAIAAALVTVHGRAAAQALPEGVRLGMTAAELQEAAPGLRKVARPERMANGARGLWQQTQPGDEGLVFELTYFVRAGAVDRADLVLVVAPEGSSAAFERIVGTLRSTFGSELRSKESMGSSISETASWSAGDEDVAAYMTGPRDAERIRVIYKRRELKDGGAL